MESGPTTIGVAEVTRRGWEMAERALASATGPRSLVSHWFVTPQDDSVHVDDELGGDRRTLTFLRLVIPTLAERLQASIVAVAVPWSLRAEAGPPLLVLLALVQGQPAELQARRLISTGAEAPWWSLGEDLMVPPVELVELAERLRI